MLFSGLLSTSEGSKQRSLKVEPLLAVAAFAFLLVGCLAVMKPFFTAIVWAVILAYILSPLQRMFARWFRGSRTLAACMVSLIVAGLFVGPVVLIGVRLAQDGKELAGATREWFKSVPLEPPAWLERVPVLGSELTVTMGQLAEDRARWLDQLDEEMKKAPRALIVEEENDNLDEINEAMQKREQETTAEAEEDATQRSPHAVVLLGRFVVWARAGLISAGKSIGQGVVEVMFSVFLAFFFLRDGTILAQRLRVIMQRLAGERGLRLTRVAGGTVRSVIVGILGTALAQAVVAWFGFWLADVPGAVLLAVLTFFFAVVPFGPPLIWIPATIWLYGQDRPGWAIFMGIYGLVGISSVDNILKPYLISFDSKMPFVLIFCGVVGGVLAFGLVGVFLGPTLLAVTYRVIDEWTTEEVEIVEQEKENVIA